MLALFARYWWTFAVRGVAAIVFGLLALIWPVITLTVLVLLFGLYVLADGLVALAGALMGRRLTTERRWLLTAEGVLGVAAGVLTFIWPGITALVLLWLIAAWAIVTGISEIVTAIRLRRELEREWLLALLGVLSIAFGIILAVRPGAGALAITWLIGAYAIVFGVVLVGLALRLRRYRGIAGPMPEQPGRPTPA